MIITSLLTSVPERYALCTEFSSTGSSEHMKIAQYWLDERRSKHRSCQAAEQSFWPSRVIYVGTKLMPLRLCHKIEFGNSANYGYCSLSHCWGGVTDIIRLVQNNVKKLQDQIFFEDLLLTFRDAVLITRRLGLQYLWIDSLCITQDSKSDWEKEALLMGKAYENSTITIVAANAKKVQGGCFSAVKPLLLNPCYIVGSEHERLSCFRTAPTTGVWGRRLLASERGCSKSASCPLVSCTLALTA
jgi:hypothetical protein